MDPVSITLTAVGWLMSSLVDKAVTALLEAWAKRTGLEDELETLKYQLLQIGSLLINTRGLPTNNSFLEVLVQDLQQLTYRAENLLDELDYYRLQDEIHQRATQEEESSSNKSSVASSSSSFLPDSIRSTLEGMTCRSAPDVLVSLSKILPANWKIATQEKESSSNKSSVESSSSSFLPTIDSIRSTLEGMTCRSAPKTLFSERMNKLAEQLQKSEANVRKAVKTELLYRTACKTEATKLRQTSSFLTEPIVFGRDQERGQLVNLLTNEESAIVGKVPILAIVGSGGVGKTTLARQVFNDKKVHGYFQVRLWICVSTRFDIYRLTREMLEGACGTKCDLTNLNELQNKLKNELGSKRFLLVLDDMWEDKDENQWKSIVAPLNNCMEEGKGKGNGSIILVTTRNHNVAKIVDATYEIPLKGLDENAFLSFFSTCIFNDPNFGGNGRLRKIGQEIANKLKCNPLAAKTVSALLKENLDERYWMEIRDSEEWKSQSGQDHIMPALRLSYEHMPFHLQRCFSYCAILPEDHPFTCEELVYQWMAQGYLDVRFEEKRVEDIGRAYFNDLFNRGFFQTIQSSHLFNRGFFQTIESSHDEVHYTFHDLIHDLANMVASKECLTINGPKSRQITPTIRHLSIFTSTERGEESIVRELTCLKGKGEHLSTIFNWDELSSGTFRSFSDLLKETKFLRAMRLTLFLELQPHNLNFPNFISLRYLKLITPSIFTTLHTLPEEICRLYHLEVLQISNNWSMLPDNFSDLVSLRHFIVEHSYFPPNIHSKIQGVGKLTSLQELNHFVVQQKKGFEIEQLGSLKEIRGSLHIWHLENVKSKTEASKARLAEKEKLDALYLYWNHGEQENESVLEGLKPTTNLKSLTIDGYGGVASPTWLEPSLSFLKSLFLKGCKAWELLPPIGELESLKCLELSELAVREIGPQCYGTRQSMKFPSLEKLEIKKMPDLEKWVWSDQLQQFLCFKKLKKLTIRNCPNLVDLPLSGSTTSEVLERFPSLETLIINKCPLIFQLSPLPYSSLLSTIDIRGIGCINELSLRDNQIWLIVDKSSSLKLDEVLAFHELGSLRYLEISNSSLESLDFHPFQSMKFPSLEMLKIEKMPDLKKWVWSDQPQQFLCFKKLKELTIRDCPNLVDLPLSGSATSEVLERFPSLETLIIQRCPLIFQLPHIGELESLKCLELSELAVREIGPQCYGTRQSMKFPSLEKLEIKKMPDLEKWVWSDQLQPFLCFKKLKELTIRDCPNLVDLPLSGSTSEVLERFPSLETLIINDCPLIFQLPPLPYSSLLSTIYIRGIGCINELSLRDNLIWLIVDKSSSLKLDEVLAFHELGSLRYLEISNFSSLESLDFHPFQSMKFPSLEMLKTEKMPDLKKWVWSDQPQQFICFKKLKELTIRDCPNLVDLPLSGSATSEVLERFPSLETLIIQRCPLIFQLPHIGELESLKCLELSELAVREIGPQCYGTRQSMKFPSLEKLEIKKMPDLEKWVWSDQLQQFLCFKKLKELTIRDCPNLVDLPLSGSTSEVLERFPSLETLIINECPLIFQLPPLPYSSLLSTIYISGTGCINELCLGDNKEDLIMDKSSSLKLDEVLAFHELSSLRFLEISNFSSLESLDLHSFVALQRLKIRGCQSLTSITFVEHLVSLMFLEITSCKSLRSMKGVKSWVNLYVLQFRECPGFIPAWDTASKEIERTEPDFSSSLTTIRGDSLALITLPICKQLSSLQYFELEFSSFTEEQEVSPQFLTSLDLVDIRGCKKNLQSFPFDLFPSLKEMCIKFPRIRSLPTSSCIEITDECKKLRNIKEVHLYIHPLQIYFDVSSEEMISQQMEADN